MKKKSFLRLMLLGFILGLALAGCSTTQVVNLSLRSQAEMTLELRLSNFFVNYLRDLGGKSTGPVFDTLSIAVAMHQLGIEVRQLETVQDGTLRMTLIIPDPQQIASQGLRIPEFIRWNAEQRPSELRITITQEIIRRVLGSTSLIREESLSFLLPPPGASTNDYLEDLVWIFEDYEPEPRLRQALTSATLEITLSTPRDILHLSGPGFSQSSARQARLNLNVLEMLTLRDSRVFTLRY
jgi:hypothetical protein